LRAIDRDGKRNSARDDGAPPAKDIEITGPMTATLWAVTSGKDRDWNVMLQHVYPDGRTERIQDGVMRARFRDGFAKDSAQVSLCRSCNFSHTKQIAKKCYYCGR